MYNGAMKFVGLLQQCERLDTSSKNKIPQGSGGG